MHSPYFLILLNLQAEPHDGRVTLTWDGIPQSSLWHVYSIYISQVDSGTVLNMTAIQDVSGTTFDVTGLTNNTHYYFAVVTKNLNGFFRSNGDNHYGNTYRRY